MKKLKFLAWAMLMVLACTGFAACSEDDDNDNDFKSLLIGTWVEEEDPDYGVIFKSDGTVTSFGSGTYTGTYTVNSDEIRIREYDEYYDEYDVYSVFIMSLSESRLVLMDEDRDTMTYRRIK